MKTSKCISLAILGLTLTAPLAMPAFAATARPVKTATSSEAAILSILATLSQAASNGDAAKMAALWTNDGSYIDEDGNKTDGKVQIQKRFAEGLSGNRAKITLKNSTMKFLGVNNAWVEGITCKQIGATEACTRFTMLLQRAAGNWQIVSATETSIPETSQTESQNPVQLNSLNWLIGNWTAASADKKVTMTADWVGNKNFIICKYIAGEGTNKNVDVQIIGYDPIKKSIVSWHFDSAGGFGYGDWSQSGNTWQIASQGVAPGGVKTGAINIITQDGGDKFTWQSINRSIAGTVVPNIEPLTVVRVGK